MRVEWRDEDEYRALIWGMWQPQCEAVRDYREAAAGGEAEEGTMGWRRGKVALKTCSDAVFVPDLLVK